jgi:type III secretory pathway component EscR
MQPFTRADLNSQREEYAMTQMQEYINKTVEKIYYAARKAAVERSSHEFYYKICERTFVDITIISDVIQDKLQALFPDFTITVGNVNDGYNHSRYICVKW